MIKHINEDEFNSVINGDLVLIDFYAEWCGPCKMLSSVLQDLSNERSLKIYKVNVDENESLAKKMGVMSIPSVFLYKNGKMISNKLGFMPKEEIINWIQNN